MSKEKGPTPKEIIAARNSAHLTQTEAATLVHNKLRAWQRWEAGDRTMPAAVWELFQIKGKAKRKTERRTGKPLTRPSSSEKHAEEKSSS
jgi:putative transcriptional regulator